MTGKPSIVYIKDGKERVLFGERFLAKFVFKILFCQTSNSFEFSVRDDISYLEFRNYLFKDRVYFRGANQDTILVFDHCYFHQGADFRYGSVQLIEPSFSGNLDYVVAEYLDNFDVIHPKNYLSAVSYGMHSIKNIAFDGNDSGVGSIVIRNSLNIFLRRIKTSDYYRLDEQGIDVCLSDYLKIENSHINLASIEAKCMELHDTYLVGGDTITKRCCLNVPKIVGDSFSVRIVGSNFLVNDHVIFCQDNQELFFTDQDFLDGNITFSRIHLLSFFKNLEKVMTSENEQSLRRIESQLVKKKIRSYKRLTSK